MKVAIAGGGVGGLALALALHERGIEATVYERQPEVRELGVGINVLPHAIAHLERWGLLPALDRTGIRTRWLVYKTADGRDILRQPRGFDAGLDAPQFSIHRGRLQRLLLEAVRRRLGEDAVHTSHRLTEQGTDGDRAWARFETPEGPREICADALVGADGIHSVVRGTWHEEGPPSWSGVVMWRGALWWAPFGDGRTMIVAGGMRAKLVLYPIAVDESRPGETLMNWVVCAKVAEPSDPLPHRDDWQGTGRLADVMAHVTGRLSVPELDLPALIHATDGIWVYPMCDRDPLPRWTNGRVTLLGDAAHPMYPVGSNGASQAVLDAVSLAGHLAERGPDEGLGAYEAERRPATAAIVRANREGGPERVIDLVEARAPEGFTSLDEVATEAELRAVVGDFQSMAGFDAVRG